MELARQQMAVAGEFSAEQGEVFKHYLRRDLEQSIRRLSVQEQSVRAHELQRVPLDRIVARRYDDPTCCTMMLNRQLCGRRRYQAAVND